MLYVEEGDNNIETNIDKLAAQVGCRLWDWDVGPFIFFLLNFFSWELPNRNELRVMFFDPKKKKYEKTCSFHLDMCIGLASNLLSRLSLTKSFLRIFEPTHMQSVTNQPNLPNAEQDPTGLRKLRICSIYI